MKKICEMRSTEVPLMRSADEVLCVVRGCFGRTKRNDTLNSDNVWAGKKTHLLLHPIVDPCILTRINRQT